MLGFEGELAWLAVYGLPAALVLTCLLAWFFVRQGQPPNRVAVQLAYSSTYDLQPIRCAQVRGHRRAREQGGPGQQSTSVHTACADFHMQHMSEHGNTGMYSYIAMAELPAQVLQNTATYACCIHVYIFSSLRLQKDTCTDAC